MSTSFEYDAEFACRQEQLAKTPELVALRRTLLAALSLQQGEHVLDVGSGNGILVREIAGRIGASGTVTGVDASEAMVTMARGLCSENSNVVFEQVDAS